MALKDYGDILKKIRVSAGFNQVDLAQKLRIDQASISRYEKNERKVNLEILTRYAEFFGLELDYLVNGSVNYHELAARFNQELPIADRYKKNVTSSLREILPFMQFINQSKGPQVTKSILKSLGLESFMFLGPSEKISSNAVFDFLEIVVAKKLVGKSIISKIIKLSHSSELHGASFSLLNDLESSVDKINLWAIQSRNYDSFYQYNVLRAQDELTLKIQLKLSKDELKEINPKVLDFYSSYREAYLRELPKTMGKSKADFAVARALPVEWGELGELWFSNAA